MRPCGEVAASTVVRWAMGGAAAAVEDDEPAALEPEPGQVQVELGQPLVAGIAFAVAPDLEFHAHRDGLWAAVAQAEIHGAACRWRIRGGR